MAQRRVVITGLGAVSPVGNNVKDSWENIKAGKSGVDKITLFDASDYPVQIAAEVKEFNLESYGVDRKAMRKMNRQTKFLLGACIEAVNDAGYTKESIGKENIGITNGVGIGLNEAVEAGYKKYYDPTAGVNRLPPLTAPLALNNEAAANVSMYFGITGPSWTLSTACSSGTDSIGLALDMIRGGRMDMALACGSDADITGFNIGCYQVLQALCQNFNDNPKEASRPFDKNRCGFVMGEGAAVLVLEELEHAKARGAKIYAEMVGEGESADAYHITASHPDGLGAKLVMQNALEDAGLNPEDIDYINVHGTSTHVGDISEAKAIKDVFGEAAYKLNISSTKSMTGHLLGAAGAVEAMVCILAVKNDIIPPTINHDDDDLDPEIDYNLNFTFNKAQKREVRAALSNTFGFGGHNACVVFKKYAE